MTQSTMPTQQRHFSPRATLAALGIKLRSVDLFGPIRDQVKIAQKTVKHTPVQKVYDAFITILAGAHGLVEINTRLRSDLVLQRAFGRTACAEQSVVQETLLTTASIPKLRGLSLVRLRYGETTYARTGRLARRETSSCLGVVPARLETKGHCCRVGRHPRRGQPMGQTRQGWRCAELAPPCGPGLRAPLEWRPTRPAA